MENVLQQKVVFQQIGNVNMEDFIADLKKDKWKKKM